jgi:hypothetical protein
MKKALTKYYARYFTAVTVEVRSSVINSSDDTKYQLYISITADGLTLEKALSVNGGKLLNLIGETQK